MTPQRHERITSVIQHRQADLTIVLENVWDPHNVSAVMRTCDSVGIQDVYVIHNDIRNIRYGKRSSASAANWLTVHSFETVDDCVQSVVNEGFKLFATHLDSQAISLYKMDFTHKIALVFGNEKEGVSQKLLNKCEGNFIIPQVGMIKSLNISVACAVSLYEAFRQKEKAGHYPSNNAMNEAKKLDLEKRWGVLNDIDEG